jgi:hypothetical protein
MLSMEREMEMTMVMKTGLACRRREQMSVDGLSNCMDWILSRPLLLATRAFSGVGESLDSAT